MLRIFQLARAIAAAAFTAVGFPALAWYTEPPSTAVWAYRVPIVLPAAAAVNSTVRLNVDFNPLFTQLSLNPATTTLDVLSPRIVRGNETRAARQEFNDGVYNGAVDAANNERGEIRFILDDAPAAGTYYLYFDATSNGTKPTNPATVINGTFEQSSGSTPTQWTATVVNAGTNRNNEVYRTAAGATVTVTAACATNNTTGIDAGPNIVSGVATGSAWHLLGFRDRCEDGGSNSEQVRLSRSIAVPSGAAAGNLTFYFQVQGWDGIENATNYDWVIFSVNGTAMTHTALSIANATTPTLVIEAARLGRNGYSTTYRDHGWKRATLALAPFAGQTITLMFATRHYTDNDYRSWLKLDDVEWSMQSGTLGTPEAFGGGIRGFDITHDGFGIHCVDETIVVRAIDTSGNTVVNYVGQITLTTQSGRGTWLLTTGNGTFVDATANDGVATYQYAASDLGVATFRLQYREGTAVIDVDTYQTSDTSIRDDDTEGSLTFAPNGFTVTRTALTNPPPAVINDPIPTQTAGTAFDVHLAAYGQTATDAQCGIIETYTGNKSVAFWVDRLNPATGTLTPTVNGTTIAAAAGTATAQVVAFTAGQAVVTAKYKDVGSIRLNARDSLSFAPALVVGASNTFVVRPADLVVVLVATAAGVANPGASTATGAAFVPSGTAFRVEVEVRDSEGSGTPNFGAESPAETLLLTSASLVIPVGGRNGSSGIGTLVSGGTFTSLGAGRFRNVVVAFDEVGIIRLRASVADGSYLATGALNGTMSGNVGRFYPASYVLVAGSSISPACNGFTYMSQPSLGVGYTLEARNTLAGRTENYAANLLGAGAVSTVTTVAENANDGVDRGARLSGLSSSWTLGRYATTTTVAAFARAASADGPFDTLEIGSRVTDALDNVALAALNMNASTTGNCVAAANCTAARIGAATRVVFGRLVVKPAFGPETRNLAIPLEAQRFDAGAYTLEPADVCTTYRASNTTLSGHSGNLALGETTMTAPAAATAFVGGHTNPSVPLVLSAPGNGHDGSVDVTFDAPTWLEFDWFGAGATNPRATARFGRYRGHDRIIYWREQ